MSDAIRLLPPRVPVIDVRTGTMARDWYVFFQQIYIRLGGANAPSITDLNISKEDIVAYLLALDQAPAPQPFVPPDEPENEWAALRDQVAELTKTLEGAQVSINQLNDTIAELRKEIDALRQATIGGQP